MTKKIKIVAFLAFIILSFSFVCLPALAAEKEDGAQSYEWYYDEERGILKNSDREYSRVELPVGYRAYSKGSIYVFENYYYEYYSDLYSYERQGEIIWEDEDADVVFATEIGKSCIDALIGGDYSNFALFVGDMTSDLDTDFVARLDGLTKSNGALPINVRDLSPLGENQIRAYDATSSVYYVYGAVHEYSGGYYYVCYDQLPNSNFDANGNFSYRRGTVYAYKLDGELLSEFEKALRSVEYKKIYTYEADDLGGEPLIPYRVVTLLQLGVVLAVIGYALPAIIGVLSLRRAKSTVPEHKKLWYITAGAAGAWVALSIAVTLILIFG